MGAVVKHLNSLGFVAFENEVYGEGCNGSGGRGIGGVFCPSKATEDSFVKRMENETLHPGV